MRKAVDQVYRTLYREVCRTVYRTVYRAVCRTATELPICQIEQFTEVHNEQFTKHFSEQFAERYNERFTRQCTWYQTPNANGVNQQPKMEPPPRMRYSAAIFSAYLLVQHPLTSREQHHRRYRHICTGTGNHQNTPSSILKSGCRHNIHFILWARNVFVSTRCMYCTYLVDLFLNDI